MQVFPVGGYSQLHTRTLSSSVSKHINLNFSKQVQSSKQDDVTFESKNNIKNEFIRSYIHPCPTQYTLEF